MVYQIQGNVMKNESKINTYQKKKNEISEDIVMPVIQNQKRIQEKKQSVINAQYVRV